MFTPEEKQYEEFIQKHPMGTFFQSWAFGKFQEKIPYRGKTWALIKKDTGGKIAGTCLVIKQKLPLNYCWLWIPYGPLGAQEEIFEDLARIAKEEKAIFARIEPPIGFPAPDAKKWKIAAAPNRFTPEHTLVLDLEKTEDEILAQMKPKGRYNIQVAKKHNVEIRRFDNFEVVPPTNFDLFYKILQTTARRDAFGIHPKYFYKTLLKTFCPQNMAALFLAYEKAKVIAGIIVVFYKNTTTYYYGASDYKHRNLMAPYLLQWGAIREAKKRGVKYYDFLGISPDVNLGTKNHPWAGVTEFKKKFGGREMTYPPAFNIIYKPTLYRLGKVARGFF